MASESRRSRSIWPPRQRQRRRRPYSVWHDAHQHKSYFTHHTQQIAKAAVMYDARAILKRVTVLK